MNQRMMCGAAISLRHEKCLAGGMNISISLSLSLSLFLSLSLSFGFMINFCHVYDNEE